MATMQQPVQTLPAKGSDSDPAVVWVVIATIVAIACAVGGWAYAPHSVPSRGEIDRYSAIAAQDGASRGMASGYRFGARAGRAEANLAAKAAQIRAQSSARQAGFSTGVDAGREQAALKAGDQDMVGLPGASDAYPADGYESISASGLFDEDAPDFSTSAYSSYGYGSSAALPTYSGGAASDELIDQGLFDF